jgi:hypothetical protein
MINLSSNHVLIIKLIIFVGAGLALAEFAIQSGISHFWLLVGTATYIGIFVPILSRKSTKPISRNRHDKE